MIRKTHLFMLVFSLLFISCSKENKDSKSNYLEVTINGKSYREERPIDVAIGNYAGEFCNSDKPNQGWNIMDIELSDLFISADLNCFEDDEDFQYSVPGSYNMVDGVNYEIPCSSNLDIVLSFGDYTISDPVTLQYSNRVHTVTNIYIQSQTSTSVDYIVTGTFSCSYKSDVNNTYSVSGKYQTLIITRK